MSLFSQYFGTNINLFDIQNGTKLDKYYTIGNDDSYNGMIKCMNRWNAMLINPLQHNIM